MSDDSGPAFPTHPFTQPSGDFCWPQNGLTKLEYYAAHADIPFSAVMDVMRQKTSPASYGELFKMRAEMAFAQAEAMINAGEKVKNDKA